MKRLPALPDNPFFVRSAALLVVLAALVTAFTLYARKELRVDAINVQREQSLTLMDELRQSSQDLTKLARSYAATGKSHYRRYFEEVLAIRDGLQPRPERYDGVYWDLVLADGSRPRPFSAERTPLLERMRKAGFTASELYLLQDSKRRSDSLTKMEYEAMELAADGKLEQSDSALFGDRYDRAKRDIMQSIDVAFVAIDERTREAVAGAQAEAITLRTVVVVLGVLSMAMLVELYFATRRTLGGTMGEIHEVMLDLAEGRLGRVLAARKQDSVLGWLGQMQHDLQDADKQKRESARQLRESFERLDKIARMVPGMVHVFQRRADGNLSFPYASNAMHGLYGTDPECVRNDAALLLDKLHPDDRSVVRDSMMESVRTLAPWHIEYRVTQDESTDRWLLNSAVPERQPDGSVLWFGYTTDVTDRRRAVEESRVAAIAFDTKEGMLVTDAAGRILRVNRALATLSGYSLAELAGDTPQRLYSLPGEPALQATIAVAIGQHDTWEGEIELRRKDGSECPVLTSITAVRGLAGEVTHYVHMFVDNSERKAREELVRRLAYFDALTGLPNRRMLMDRLQQALYSSGRSKRHGALCFIDLDKFKALNDTHGHEYGDRLLQQVAQRLQDCVRAGDTVARLGGDEFVLVLETLDAEAVNAYQQAQGVGAKVLAALAKPFQLDDLEWNCSGSLGLTLFGPHPAEPDMLLKQADMAMYEAKKAGRNALRCYSA